MVDRQCISIIKSPHRKVIVSLAISGNLLLAYGLRFKLMCLPYLTIRTIARTTKQDHNSSKVKKGDKKHNTDDSTFILPSRELEKSLVPSGDIASAIIHGESCAYLSIATLLIFPALALLKSYTWLHSDSRKCESDTTRPLTYTYIRAHYNHMQIKNSYDVVP